MFTASSRHAPRAWGSLQCWLPVLGLCAATLGLPVCAQPTIQPITQPITQPTLSLDEALRLATERSLQLPAQDAAAAAAREMAVAAGQLPDPTLKAGVNNLPLNGAERFSLTRDFMTMRSVGVMQEFTRDDKRKLRSARYEREAEVAQAGRTVALANLRRETAVAWLDRHYQERLHDLLRLQRSETTLQIEAAEAAYRGGRGSLADVFAARSAVAQIDDRIRQAELQISIARTRLTRWVGADAERALAALPSLGAAGPETVDLESHLQQHPQILLMASQETVARAETEMARSNRRSDWSVELMLSQRGSAYSNMVSVNVSVPLQWDPKNRQDREVSARLALAEQLRAQREEAAREHLAETRGWLQQWQGNRDRLVQYDSVLIPLAGERTRAAIATYRGGGAGGGGVGGGGTLAAVLEARRSEIDMRIERLRLEMETAGLWARLEYLIPRQHPPARAVHPAVAAEPLEPTR